MTNSSNIRFLVSPAGVEAIDVLYIPGQRAEAWRFCEKMLPVIQALERAVKDLGCFES